MPVVQLPDGTLVQLPEETPSTGMDVLKAAGSKLAEGALKAPFMISDLLNLGLDATNRALKPDWMQSDAYKQFREAHKGSGWLEEAGIPFYQPQTTPGRYVGAAAGALGGGLSGLGLSAGARTLPEALISAGPASAQTIKSAALPVATGSVAGGLAAEGTQDIPGLQGNPVAAAGAGTIASIVGALLGKGMTPRAQKQLFDAGRTVPGEDWQKAFENRAKLESTGSASYTLGDVFPEENRYSGVTSALTGEKGGEELARRLAGRKEDLIAQGEAAKSSAGPAISSLDETGQDAARAADNRIGQFEAVRSAAFKKLVESAPDVKGKDVSDIYNLFRQKAQQQDLPQGQRDAYNQLADVLVQDGARFKTNVAALSRDIKANKDRTLSPGAETAAKIGAMDYNPVYQELSDSLERLSPAFAQANSRYQRISEALVNPAKAGPLGQIAGRNFREDTGVPASRPMEIVRGQSPNDVQTVMASLAKGAPNDPGLKARIARSILDQTIPNRAPNAMDRILAASGPDPKGAFEQLVTSAGGDTRNFLMQLEANKMLQSTQNRAPTAGLPPQTPSVGEFLSAPFSATRTAARVYTSEKTAREISALFANPTEANLLKLKAIAETDPAVKASLVRAGIISSQSSNTGR